MKVYADVLPREDSTQLIFWPKEVLTEIDSQLLIQQYRDTLGYYQMIHRLLVSDPDSPYNQIKDSLPFEEFLWAFSVVSSRQLSLNNGEQVMDDPNLQLLIMPLLDFINHTQPPLTSSESKEEGPNVRAMPYHDPVNNESFVMLEALYDIKKGDQLLMSYGRLSN